MEHLSSSALVLYKRFLSQLTILHRSSKLHGCCML